MRGPSRRPMLVACVACLLGLPATAAADHRTRAHTQNMHAVGHSPSAGTILGAHPEDRNANSDIAFRGDLVFNGNYDGLRIIRRTQDDGFVEVGRARCNGDQGDIVVWGDLLVRAWNSPAPADDPATADRMEARFCDGLPVTPGFEGMHIWDISDLSDPDLIGEVELSARPMDSRELKNGELGCGSHTLTAVPDEANNRLLVYNATSGGNRNLPEGMQDCDWLDIIEVPLGNPSGASHLHREPLAGGHAAHDSGAILGDVDRLAVASGHMSNVFDIGGSGGGSIDDPEPLFTIEEPGVCNVPDDPNNPNPQRPCNGNWHSAGFTWDGEVIILGWEPGGGAQPECEETDPVVKKSAFFYDADTGRKLGQWTLPRPQSAAENCTIHNYNTVPTRNGRYILVSGNYQAGTWVTDFSDPSSPDTLGWSDPPPLPQVTTPSGRVVNDLGGAWSSYWYNGRIYESEITKGLNVFKFSGRQTGRTVRTPHLNPQTQEFTIG